MMGIAVGRSLRGCGPGTARAPLRYRGAALVALIGLVGPLLADGAAGARISAEATGVSRAREAQGWLQLEADQRAARTGSEPLKLLQSRQIQIREREERNRLAETFQDQGREIDTLRRAGRQSPDPGLPGFGREARMRGLLMRQGQELEGLRLRQGMARERLGIYPGPYLRR